MLVPKVIRIVLATRSFRVAWPFIYKYKMASEERCIFCKIFNHTMDATILYEDDEYMVFKDIKAAAKHHYLVIPKVHIKGANFLKKEDIPMLERMEQLARKTLEDQGAPMHDIRLGFHWPPFNSINHLHLHSISPTSEMGSHQRLVFKPGTYSFVTLEYMYKQLIKLPN